MIVSLPYRPSHSMEWLEEYFSKNYFKKPYDRFMWWRSYTTKTKPLHTRAPLHEKILNGDYDLGSFKYEVEVVEHRLNVKYTEFFQDQGRYVEQAALDRARRKRLLEDFEKDENRKIQELKSQFSNLIGESEETVEQELMEFDGDLIDFFYYIIEKFPRKNGFPYL